MVGYELLAGPQRDLSAEEAARSIAWCLRGRSLTVCTLICGEALYDVFIDPMGTDVPRKIDLTAKPGGSPYNVAIGLARLGCPVALATELAEDTLGRNLGARPSIGRRGRSIHSPHREGHTAGDGRHRLRRQCALCVLWPRPTCCSIRSWRPSGNSGVVSWACIWARFPSLPSNRSKYLLDLARTAPGHVLVSFDPNVRLTIEPDVDCWRGAVERFRHYAHLIKVSEEDLTSLFGADCDIEAIARGWLEHRCSLVAVTRGARGATYFSRQAGKIEVLPVRVVVADTVGAGDSFQAAIAGMAGREPARVADRTCRLEVVRHRTAGRVRGARCGGYVPASRSGVPLSEKLAGDLA